MRISQSATAQTIVFSLHQRTTFISTRELMTLLGVRRDTVCEWVRDGKLAAIKLTSGYIFEPSVVATWLEARSTR